MRVRRMEAQKADAAAWISSLNACFPGWGGLERFAWCFLRSGAGRPGDAIFIEDDGRTIAGSAVTYRRLQLPDARTRTAGVMTGSWTLPDARGRGAFTRIVEESRAAAADRGSELLLAFVTAANASRRRLEAAGAWLSPSFYCRASPSPPDAVSAEIPGISPDTFRRTDAPGRARFTYEGDEWRAQFVSRPGRIRGLSLPGGCSALVGEERDLRVLALATPPEDEAKALAHLSRRRSSAGRGTFVFTTRGNLADALAAYGFGIVPGFVSALPASAPSLEAALEAETEEDARRLLDWDLQDGDRM